MKYFNKYELLKECKQKMLEVNQRNNYLKV